MIMPITDLNVVFPVRNHVWYHEPDADRDANTVACYSTEASTLTHLEKQRGSALQLDPWNRALPSRFTSVGRPDGEIMGWVGITTVAGNRVKLFIEND